MQAEDLILDQGGEGEEIEQVGEILPDVCVAVFTEALVVETVYLRNLARFVIAAKNGDSLGVADFESDEEGHRLDREVATINVVT